jgi:hypothetical protein
MKRRLFAEVGLADLDESADYTMVVYGELMINKHFFDYQQRQLSSGNTNPKPLALYSLTLNS